MNAPLVLVGAAGGLLALVVHVIDRQKKAPSERTPYDAQFWLVHGMILPALGAFVVYLYLATADVKLNAFLAANIGASAPLIAKGMGTGVHFSKNAG